MSGKGSLNKQNPKGCTKSCDFGLSKRLTELSSPVRYLKHLRGKVAAAVVRMRAAPPPCKSHQNHKERAKPGVAVAPVDSQRAEAIHDCIDFINSSSSLPRSNSVARPVSS